MARTGTKLPSTYTNSRYYIAAAIPVSSGIYIFYLPLSREVTLLLCFILQSLTQIGARVLYIHIYVYIYVYFNCVHHQLYNIWIHVRLSIRIFYFASLILFLFFHVVVVVIIIQFLFLFISLIILTSGITWRLIYAWSIYSTIGCALIISPLNVNKRITYKKIYIYLLGIEY